MEPGRSTTNRIRRWWGAAAVAAAALLGTTAGTMTPAGAATADTADTTEVYVLQGIAGQSLAVQLDGKEVSKAVPSRTVVGPLEVSPGQHTVRVLDGSTVTAEATFSVEAGSSTDVVAHRFPDANRAPSFTVYDNDLSAVGTGKTRLRIAHTAVVPPADIVVNDSVLISNLANGESAVNVVPAGSYKVAIVPTATTGPAVFGPTTLDVAPGTMTNVFAIGDPKAGTMDAIVQVLPVKQSGSGAPSRVNTGDGGQAAALVAGSAGQDRSLLWAGGLLAALLVLAGPVMWRAVRR